MSETRRLHAHLRELEQFFNIISLPLPIWKWRDGHHPEAAKPDFDDSDWQTCTLPRLWGGSGGTCWFRTQFTLDKRFHHKPVRLHFELFDECGEALVYINGEAVQGIDRNHREVLLTESGRSGEHITLSLEAWDGASRQCFSRAAVVQPDTGVRGLFFVLKNGLEAFELLPAAHPDRENLLNALRTFSRKVDWRTPGSAAFRESCAKADKRLNRVLARMRSELNSRVFAVGHAHIDTTWLWPLQETRRKCARTFATMLRLMEQHADFHFIHSQPEHYLMIKQDHPGLYEKIRRRVLEGRWEPVGGMWVEADCNIPGGESLVRQVLYGKRFFRQEFDLDIDTMWLPDTFGYSAALPQIMRKSGIRYFFSAKLAWNDHTAFPYSTFYWRGIDGSRVLAHLSFQNDLYNNMLTATELHEAWQRFKQKKSLSTLLLTFGHGDGGGGPTEEHLLNARHLHNMPGLPRLEQKPLGEFFRTVEREAHDLPEWWGELYFEGHRGTLTTHARQKQLNRRAELALREAEYFAALVSLMNKAETAPDFSGLWHTLLRNQFHDTLPGTSIPAVYEQTEQDYREILQACEKSVQASLRKLGENTRPDPAHVCTVFNTLGWTRNEPVTLRIPRQQQTPAFRDNYDRPVPHQIISESEKDMHILLQPEVPSCGYAVIFRTAAPARPERNQLKASPRTMESPHFILRLNREGQIISLYDKLRNRDVIVPTEPGNVLQTWEDVPAQWEAWDIDADFEQEPLSLFRCTGTRVLEQGPLRAVLEVSHESEYSQITQQIILYRELPRIDFHTVIDWHEQRVLLKVLFPVAVLSPRAAYEIQFGALERPTTRNTLHEQARYEVAAQRWADISEGNYGVSLLNDCKYGYDIRGNCLRLTLLRAPYAPDVNAPENRVNYAAPADQGRHELTYSLYPHPGDWRQALTVRRGYELNVPLRVVSSGQASFSAPPSGFSHFFECEHENIILDGLKPAEDGRGVIIRLYDSAGQRGRARIRLQPDAKAVRLCDLLENDGHELEKEYGMWLLPYKPFEIITLRLIYS